MLAISNVYFNALVFNFVFERVLILRVLVILETDGIRLRYVLEVAVGT